MIRRLVLSIAAAVSVNAQAQYMDYSGPKTLTYEKLKKMIEDGQAKTVEQALELLKAQHPEMFKKYILMYRSRSLQPSSFTHPRALLVDGSAKLIVTFNGDPAHRGYQNLEVMEYHDEGKRFEFRDIRFNGQQAPLFSGANPQRCMVCHQSMKRQEADPRPNWEPYSLWPGAYGSNGDMKFTSTSIRHDDRIKPEDAQFVEDHLSEPANYKKFEEEVKPSHARYRLLEALDSELTVRLTDTLLSHNYRRVIRLAQKTPFYGAYKYAFVGIGKCRHIAWPEKFEKWHAENNPRPERIRSYGPAVPSGGYGGGYGDEIGGLSAEELEKLRNYEPPKPKYKDREISDSIATMFEALGVDTRDWSTDFRTDGGRFAFRERFGLPSNPQQHMSRALEEMEPELSKLSCAELEKKSIEALEAFDREGGLERAGENLRKALAQSDPPIVNTCMKCHADANESWVPQIPFGRPQELARFIREKRFPRGSLIDEVTYRTGAHATDGEQMPPRQPISKEQRDQLLEYLKRLAR